MVLQLASKAVPSNELSEPNKLFLKRYRKDSNFIGCKIQNKKWLEITGTKLLFTHKHENIFEQKLCKELTSSIFAPYNDQEY